MKPERHSGPFAVWRLFFAAALAVFAACSGPRATTVSDSAVTNDAPPVDLSVSETFDAGPYRDVSPSRTVTVEHDVPEALMQSRADAGVLQVVDGFRVQVFSSLDRGEAAVAEEAVTEWWQDLPAAVRAGFSTDSTLAVYNDYRQPLYRVRVGDFTRRADAERLMSLMSSRFASVFVVPDRVTVRR